MNTINNITIIISIFNERKNILNLVNEIILNYKGINILIINDGSTDYPQKELSQVNYSKFNIIDNNTNEGLTYSIKKGILNTDSKYFIIMDGDFQHPVTGITNFIEGFDNDFDIIIGNRVEFTYGKFKIRKLISQIGNYFIKIKLKNNKNITDPLSGFFGGKTEIFKEVIKNNQDYFNDRGYKFLFDFLKIINLNDYKVSNFDFRFGKRKYGKSKLGYKEFFYFVKSLIK